MNEVRLGRAPFPVSRDVASVLRVWSIAEASLRAFIVLLEAQYAISGDFSPQPEPLRSHP